jgi:hypothetical protein
LSCAETGMVSPTTGSLRYALDPDVAPRVPWGPGIGFRRVYLSQFGPGGGAPAYRTSLGPRWGHTHRQHANITGCWTNVRAASLLVLLLTSPVLAGTYSLKLDARVDSTLDGKTLPSCGAVAKTVHNQHIVTKVVLDKRSRAVTVNDEEWKFVDGSAQIERREPVHYLLTLHFEHQKGFAHGTLILMGLLSDRTRTCLDTFSLSGTYGSK